MIHRLMARQPSLLRHLLAWTLGTLLCVWASFIVIGYRTGMHEADELTDGHLASVASLLLAQPRAEFMPATGVAELAARPELRAHDYQQSLSVVVWDGTGKVLGRTGRAPPPAFGPAEGFETLSLGQPVTRWRAFSRWDGDAHQHKIMVLLSLAERDDLAQDIAGQVAEPGLWLLPVVALVLVLAVRKGLRPLHDLSRQVNRLDIRNDAVLEGPPHQEFEPVVRSINTLIERYNAALERERALASEVAHELRTPLASLQLHAGSLKGELTAEERADALRRIEVDAARAGKVLSDLLALARADRAELAEAAQSLDLSELARRVLADYGQEALSLDHELSLEAAPPCPLRGHPVLLELALRNLIDNAIVHTPAGTWVQVRVACGPPSVEVRDNGRTRAHLGQAPGRPGLGLGHPLVRRVAALHGGRFEAVDLGDGGITCWRLTLGEP